VDIVTVKELLGHSDVKVTVRYTHTSRDAKVKAVRSITPAGSDKVVTITASHGNC
jgi:site-specific recombinase XerD